MIKKVTFLFNKKGINFLFKVGNKLRSVCQNKRQTKLSTQLIPLKKYCL